MNFDIDIECADLVLSSIVLVEQPKGSFLVPVKEKVIQRENLTDSLRSIYYTIVAVVDVAVAALASNIRLHFGHHHSSTS